MINFPTPKAHLSEHIIHVSAGNARAWSQNGIPRSLEGAGLVPQEV